MWLPRLDDKKVKDQMNTSKEDKRKRRKQVKDKNKGLVVMPYIQGISESFNRVLKKHNVSTVFTYVFAFLFCFFNCHEASHHSREFCSRSPKQKVHGPNYSDCI